MNLTAFLIRPVKSFIELIRKILPDGTFALIWWVLLIILGTWFPSTSVLKHIFEGDPLPKGIDSPSGALESIGLFCIAVLAWTWCNLAFLCIASAYLGIAARPGTRTLDHEVWGQVLPRAFIVFLGCLLQELALNGGLIPSPERLSSGDAQQHYLRLAVLSSIACFASAFRPAIFDNMIDSLIGQLKPDKSKPESSLPPKASNVDKQEID